MPQIVGVILAVIGLAYGIAKDYQNGNIKIPQIAQTSQNEQIAQKPQLFPLQYCTMAYDPNTDRVWYQHEDGSWRDTAPAQKKVGVYY